jgi:hypothetical protein
MVVDAETSRELGGSGSGCWSDSCVCLVVHSCGPDTTFDLEAGADNFERLAHLVKSALRGEGSAPGRDVGAIMVRALSSVAMRGTVPGSLNEYA